jgi:hypothetical protein
VRWAEHVAWRNRSGIHLLIRDYCLKWDGEIRERFEEQNPDLPKNSRCRTCN